MLARRNVEFPTLGYWPGFPQVATRRRDAFAGPFATLGGCTGGGCSSDTGILGGLGYFDSGLDLAGWGVAEWGTVAGALYLLVTSLMTTGRGVRKVRRAVRARGARQARRAALMRQLQES